MKTLFDQTRIGNLKLKNRLIRSATCENLARDGHMTEELFQVYKELAQGGAGTIITGFSYVLESDKAFPGMLGIYNDSYIEEYKKLTEMIHSYEANAVLQVVYCGSYTMTDVSGREIWGPSAIENRMTNVQPKEMAKEDIVLLQKAFADAVYRGKKAGFDAAQLHAAHGFLLNQFLSPYYNRRTDEYGGSVENRTRMLLETYQVIREKVGLEYPIFIKINCSDFMDQGMSFEDCKYVCRKLADEGISAIEISGNYANMQIPPGQEAYFKESAAEVAAETNIPIILVGGNRDYYLMTEILNQSLIEYFSLSRPLISEPDLVKRWKAGDTSKAECTSCNACATLDGAANCILNRKNVVVNKI
jgi:2,4-dienoyl-CoA reductase-like NADH-dependent reductase (Old Yellow Enzyme family)